MNIIFLDYDGVVNTLWFQDVNGEPNFNFPKLLQVNNTQAIAWLNKLYRDIPYSIVVSSTWRARFDYKECLYKAGLSKDIEIIGRIALTHSLEPTPRGIEIQEWLDANKDMNITNFVILDDDSDMAHLKDHLVKTDSILGLTYYEYEKAREMLEEGINASH